MLTVALFLALTIQCALAGCNPGWIPFGADLCLYVSDDPLTWYGAATTCGVFGGRLVQVESQTKHDAVVAELKKRNVGDAWTAGTTVYSGVWQWIPTLKQVKAYTNWAAGEPNSPSTEKCLHFRGVVGHQWNDSPCLSQFRFVCENRAA